MSDDVVAWITCLDRSERRLLGAFRSAALALEASSGELGAQAQDEIAAALGASRRAPVLACFQAVMVTLGRHARRHIRFHAPPCPCVGADEALFLRLHAQLADGACREARVLARRLVEDSAVGTLLHHTATLARLGPAPEATAVPALTGRDHWRGVSRHLH